MTTPHLQNTDRNNNDNNYWNPVAKPCDYCHTTTALLFCRNHSASMCMSCDSKLHFPTDKHAKLWLCEVCEHSPAAVTCKADAASLCISCDRDIHAANPLARRHERVSVVPFVDSAEALLIKSTTIPSPEVKLEDYVSDDPWILPEPSFGGSKLDEKSLEFLFNDSDQFLEFDNCGIASQQYSDCVVPVQASTKTTICTHDEIDFTSFNKSSNYTTTASLNVSSSIDVGVVPDCSAFSEILYGFVKEAVTIPVMVPNAAKERVSQMGMDREARVLRYREKRKNRKYQKTVRYASRKAYAEIRPRIKGRFAKRTDKKTKSENIGLLESDIFIDDEIFGVVPSFI